MTAPADAAPPPGSAVPVVRLTGVGYAINGRTIFDGLDIAIERGKVTAIMGPSGSDMDLCFRTGVHISDTAAAPLVC